MRKFRTFFLGTIFGAGLGMLFAPKKGSELRQEVKESLLDMVDRVKEIDLGEVRENFEFKVDEVRRTLKELDATEVKNIAIEKSEVLKEKVSELYQLAVDKGIPKLKESADDLRNKVNDLVVEVVERMEEKEMKTTAVVEKPDEKIVVKRTKKTKKTDNE